MTASVTPIDRHPGFIKIRRDRFECIGGFVMENTPLGQEALSDREIESIRADLKCRIVAAGNTMDRVRLARDLALLNAADCAATGGK